MGSLITRTEESLGQSESRWRLSQAHVDDLQYITRGVEESDAGLRSASGFETARSAGVAVRDDAASSRMMEAENDDREVRELVGKWLDEGVSYDEIAHRLTVRDEVGAPAGGVRLLAVERWVDRTEWASSKLHSRRRRARRTLDELRNAPNGNTHVGVLRVVYGWPDPFVAVMAELDPEVVHTLNADTLHPLASLARYTDATEAVRQDLIDAAGEALFARSSIATHDGIRAAFSEEQWIMLSAALLGDRREHVDRIITSSDAVRRALSRQRSKRARGAFAKSVEIDATRMLREASEEYRAAWERS